MDWFWGVYRKKREEIQKNIIHITIPPGTRPHKGEYVYITEEYDVLGKKREKT
jgi:hypothetical protein